MALHEQPLLCELPHADVEIERDLAIAPDLTIDLYRLTARSNEVLPLVVIVSGYRDGGFASLVGCRFKEMASVVDWARLFASAGLAVITCSSDDPAGALSTLFATLRAHDVARGLDLERVGLYASSGNVPSALRALMRDSPFTVRSAAFAYGYMLDWPTHSIVSDAAKTFRFSDACAGRTFADLRTDVPLYIARAGRDEFPRLNESIDHFIASALAANVPLTVTNHADAPHAFDLLHDSERTRSVIADIVRFMKTQLL